MNERLSRYWQQSVQYWNKLGSRQKIMIISGVAMTFVVIVIFTYLFSQTEYSTAYTNLQAEDAAAIKQYLDSNGIPYKFSADGSAVGVPSTMVTDVKIDVESQNLLTNGSIGYGIFRDNISSFGMTDNQFDLLSMDAKAGEIQQLINAIDGVISSKVLLNIPDQSVFIRPEQEAQASASVVVQFQPGSSNQAKIDTMYNLVEKSVENLPRENITISDQYGELPPTSKLQGVAGAAGVIAQQMQIKKQYEVDIQKNIEQFLSRIMGRDKVVVNVWATLNFDQKNRQETLFTPVNEVDQQGIERSVQEIQKTYTSTGNPEGGVAGTGTTDVPTYPAAENQGVTESEEVERIVNFEVNEISQSIVSSPYVVQDLAIYAGIEPPVADDPESLSEETRQEIKNMLVSIVSTSLVDSGVQFTEEDLQNKVTVITRSFQDGLDPASTGSSNALLLYGLGGALVMAAILGGTWFVFRRRRAAANELEDLEEVQPEQQLPSIDLEHAKNENQVKKQLESFAKRKPEEFTDLLRTWLADE